MKKSGAFLLREEMKAVQEKFQNKINDARKHFQRLKIAIPLRD